MRIHPAIIAQAAATTATLMPGRFFLGVGTGENLNEHIIGQGWPETEVRQARLEEAIEIIRLLWKGGNQSYHSRHITVENARLDAHTTLSQSAASGRARRTVAR